MKKRVTGMVILAVVLSTFIASAIAVTYSGTDTYINTTYVKTATAGTTTMVASGNTNNANTVGVNTSSTKVVYVWLLRYNPNTKSNEYIYDAKALAQGYSMTVSLSRDKTEACYFQHLVKKYDTTSTTNYSSKTVIDNLSYFVYQYE